MKKPAKPVEPNPPNATIFVTNEIFVYNEETNVTNIIKEAESLGYDISNIKVRVEISDWGSSFRCLVFEFGQVEVPNPRFATGMLKYEKSMTLYEEKLAKYNEQLPLYTEWLNSEENKARNKKIKELEKELAKLKG